jgi:SAM-dependent MidA family methyltransferase
MNPVMELLAAEVARQGPIPFARFMAVALYCPEVGYYEQIRHTPGRAGDYFTSVSVGPVFGRLLAGQFADWTADCLESSQDPSSWQIVEAGAHDGRLARDLLEALGRWAPVDLARLEYVILEPSARREQWQRDTLGDLANRVRWVPDWPTLANPGVQGVIFANELLDALPARRLGWDRAHRRWFEWGVSWTGEGFGWTRLPVDPELSPTVQAWLDDLAAECSVDWADGHTVEAPEAALAWWSAAARSLRRGRLMAIDYGLEGAAWGLPARRQGTLRAYRQHRLTNALLDRPGEQDLTLHVNWDLVRNAGEADGLSTALHLPQGRWLSGVLAREIARNPAIADWSSADSLQFHTLTHPDQMGARFQVLVQTRGLD